MNNKAKNRWVPLESENSADHLDWNKAKRAVFPNLKPSSTTISLRLPDSMLDQIKLMANKRDVPYQSLMKIMLANALKDEVGKS